MTCDSPRKHQKAFTIVEVLIVIVVIAILATLTAISYSAITDNSRKQTTKTDAQTIATQLNKYKADKGSYPTDLDAITKPSGVNSTFQYTFDAATSTYCVTASVKGASAFVKSGGITAKEGGCPGHGVNGDAPITNLVLNPGVRTNTTGWGVGAAGSSGTQARVATGGPAGVTDTYYRRTNTAVATASPMSIAPTLTGTSAVSVEGSTTYTISMYARSSCVLSAGFRVDYASYNSAGTSGAGAAGPLVKNTANTWIRLSHTFTTAADTAFVRPYVSYSGPQVCAANSTFDATGAMFTKGDGLYSYGDGDSPSWIWNGTASNSTSTGPAQ